MPELFSDRIKDFEWDTVRDAIFQKKASDVERALGHAGHGTPEDFMALISPAAQPYLEEMAQISYGLTRKRFGNVLQLYIPLYLSNECTNQCTYCGFSMENKIPRKTLTPQEIANEVRVIQTMGYEHVLLVTGEAPGQVGMDYFRNVFAQLNNDFAQISLEVQPLAQAEYEELIGLGLHAVMVYQETYHRKNYGKYHLKGKKSLYDFRLETPDRLGQAGIRKTGIGCLLGLEEWRTDSFFTALHLDYLQKKYWRTRYSVSFPRMRPHAGSFRPEVHLSDAEFVQLLCAWRIYNEDVELSLSTREEPAFRNHLLKLGVTTLSAGSRTDPGGYAGEESLEQFEIGDERTPAEMADVIRSQGFEVVWKDWDKVLG
jgi:2-iminoacetate synthase